MRPPTLKDAHTHNTMITSHVKLRSRARPDQHRSQSYSTRVVVLPPQKCVAKLVYHLDDRARKSHGGRVFYLPRTVEGVLTVPFRYAMALGAQCFQVRHAVWWSRVAARHVGKLSQPCPRRRWLPPSTTRPATWAMKSWSSTAQTRCAFATQAR